MYERIKNYPRTNTTIIHAIYFTLLTAQRSKNIRFAKWSDIDFKNNLWIIKADESKDLMVIILSL